jgi:hypothetical protein
MVRKKHSAAGKTLWAYAYQMVPPQAESRLHTIKTLLDHERSDARVGAGTWESRCVVEQRITHILVVSDSPDQDREINRRLEAELKELKAGFSITASMPVLDDVTPVAEEQRPSTDG